MADEQTTEEAKPTQASTTDTATEQRPEAPQAPKPAAKPITFDSEEAFQSKVESILKDRLERKEKQAQEREAKAKREAEEKALGEQGKFKELSETQAKRLAELEPLEAQVKRFEKALTAYRDSQFKDVPEPIRALLNKMDVAEQVEWLTANASTLAPKAPTADIDATKRGNGKHEMSADEKREIAARLGVNAQYIR